MSERGSVPEEVYKSLELQTSSNRYIAINFGEGIVVSAGCSSEEQISYLRRVYYQAQIASATSAALQQSTQISEVIDDQDQRYLAKVSTFLGQESSHVEYLARESKGYVYIPYQEYGVLEDGSGSTWSISPMPEIGLSSIIRKSLMLEQYRRHPNIVPFHANAIVDTRDDKGIIFSSPSSPGDQTKAGKTAITMATVLQPESPFAYLSNEDLYLYSRINQVHNALIPAEINIGTGALNKLEQEGVILGCEKYTFGPNEKKYYMTSAGAIKEAGYKVSTGLNQIKTWAFVDLKLSDDNCDIQLLDEEAARNIFISTIKSSRAVQFRTPLVQGERLKKGDIDMYSEMRQQMETNALGMYEILREQGAQFVLIKGGLNRKQLYSAVSEFTNKK